MANFKFEQNGKLVAVPTGHKKAGWAKPGSPVPPINWKPVVMRGGGGK